MDRIKKIKIKQQDGTMSDYYPIGADASNVDIDYNNSTLEVTMKKTPRYYENVASMKLDDTLQEGDMAITLGYYTANDGGGAEYNIVNGEYTDDGGSYHEISNNLFAELIAPKILNVEVFGCKADGISDDIVYLQRAYDYCKNKNIIMFFSKRYYLSTGITVLTDDSITISGNVSGEVNNIETTNLGWIHIRTSFFEGDSTSISTIRAKISSIGIRGTLEDEVTVFNRVSFKASTIEKIRTYRIKTLIYGSIKNVSYIQNCHFLYVYNHLIEGIRAVSAGAVSDSTIRNNLITGGVNQNYPLKSIIYGDPNQFRFINNFCDYWSFIYQSIRADNSLTGIYSCHNHYGCYSLAYHEEDNNNTDINVNYFAKSRFIGDSIHYYGTSYTSHFTNFNFPTNNWIFNIASGYARQIDFIGCHYAADDSIVPIWKCKSKTISDSNLRNCRYFWYGTTFTNDLANVSYTDLVDLTINDQRGIQLLFSDFITYETSLPATGLINGRIIYYNDLKLICWNGRWYQTIGTEISS